MTGIGGPPLASSSACNDSVPMLRGKNAAAANPSAPKFGQIPLPSGPSKDREESAMPRAEQYRRHAIEAERQAKRACDRDAKEGLLEIARQWRELAERGEPRELESTEA
jgi:hypothetical protein